MNDPRLIAFIVILTAIIGLLALPAIQRDVEHCGCSAA